MKKPSDIYVGEAARANRRRRLAFGWYGGKFSHLGWLLPLLPPCRHFVETHGGSGVVTLNREPSPIETYNDLDGDLVNFFRVLRDRPDDLLRALELTPFAREEFFRALEELSEEPDEVERARCFFVRARQVRTGLAQAASLGRWANHGDTSRRGMSGGVSRWLGGVEGLPDIARRLLRVQIENRPALDVLRLYDGPETLFYCDPPYVHATRGDDAAYRFEMDDQAHRELAVALRAARGKIAVSGYRCALMDELYDGWHRHDAPEKTCHSVKETRQESLWTNY